MLVKRPCVDCSTLIPKGESRCKECKRKRAAERRAKDPRQTFEARVARRRALRRDHHRCQECGKTRSFDGHPLEVHHRDGNPANQELANLVTLCRKCHRAADHALGIRR